MGSTSPSRCSRKPLQIEDYGLIGDMHTCALVGKDGSIDFMCFPKFDSASMFARLLDTTKGGGGHWSINPTIENTVCKQRYKASTNILHTQWIHESGVIHLTDFFAVNTKEHYHGPVLMRKVACIRGSMEIEIELQPAPYYATNNGGYMTVQLIDRVQKMSHVVDENSHPDVLLQDISWVGSSGSAQTDMEDMRLQVMMLPTDQDEAPNPDSLFKAVVRPDSSFLCDKVCAKLKLHEGQEIIMLLHNRSAFQEPVIAAKVMERATETFWQQWARKCLYRGRMTEKVERSLLCLKLLTYQPTGAIVAAPTFSLPESIGGGRNWDYRYSWVRDSSFTIYVFLKMGYAEEAEAYINFIFARIEEWYADYQGGYRGSLPLMYSIDGATQLDETELTSLGGYKDSVPVRIGNAATGHIQLDIYGELMDAIYLFNKHGKPITFDQWRMIRNMIDHLVVFHKRPDMSIWEVRGKPENFTYSKIMLWVAFDRALRLAEKRCLPFLPEQHKTWRQSRDTIYEEIMDRGFNSKMNSFVQSYESNDVLDAAVLIAPLVFFITPNDPRFLGTLQQILKTPDKGGLTSAGFVFRYNVEKSDDGVGGGEGTFTICTFWLIEALVRAAKYQTGCQAPKSLLGHKSHPHRGIDYLSVATQMFENATSFANHVGLFSEEIAIGGESLGNTPQAFSHLAFVSAALNLERVTMGGGIEH